MMEPPAAPAGPRAGAGAGEPGEPGEGARLSTDGGGAEEPRGDDRRKPQKVTVSESRRRREARSALKAKSTRAKPKDKARQAKSSSAKAPSKQESKKPDLVSVGTTIQNSSASWRILEKIGAGGFGQIYKAECPATHTTLAIKMESIKANKQVMKMEVHVLRALQGQDCACKYFGCGRTSTFNYVAMSLVGNNLAQLRKGQQGQKFSLGTSLYLGVHMLSVRFSPPPIHPPSFLRCKIVPSVL